MGRGHRPLEPDYYDEADYSWSDEDEGLSHGD